MAYWTRGRTFGTSMCNECYFREFLEDGQEASDFITQVYQWCVKNGFWDL